MDTCVADLPAAPSDCPHTPFLPSEDQLDRVVSVLTAHPAHACAHGPSYRLQKNYKFLCSKHHPTHERGTWPAGEEMRAGVWEEISPTYISEHAVREWCPDELVDWVDLLNILGPNDGAALITGTLKTDRRVDAYFGTWLVPSKEQVHYADTPSCWFAVDIDELGGDPEDVDSNVKEFISEYLPEFEAAGVVVAFTGSAGIKGTRLRLIFELAEARTLAAKAAYVASVNARVGCEILDPSIYRPGHLILTADPRLVAPVETSGSVTYITVPRPLPPVRIWHVRASWARLQN